MAEPLQAPVAAEDTQDLQEMIAGLKQGRGVRWRAMVERDFLQKLDERLQASNYTPGDGPDTFTFEARTPFEEADLVIVAEDREGQEIPGWGGKFTVRDVTAAETRELRGVFWGEPEGLAFSLGALYFHVVRGVLAGDTPEQQAELAAEWRQICEVVNARNRRQGYKPPHPRFDPKTRASRTRELPPITLFASDNVHGAAVRAFSAAQDWQRNPIEGFAYGMAQELHNLQITIGLPDGTQADSLWAFLAKGGAKMVKAHYALWGRWYEDGEGNGLDFLTVNINQFCADLGYEPHKKNGMRDGYRREHKQTAVSILEALTAVEMRAVWTVSGAKPGKERKWLRGPLWSRGLIAGEGDEYSDLFGAAREGDPGLWEPVAFSYAPGPWFTSSEFRQYNSAVGKIGAGLLKLPNDKDEWAILIGGYFGTLLRTEAYADRRLRVEKILRRTNLAQGVDARRRSGEMQRYFERALDRLVEVGVIESWTWPEVDTAECADPNDPQAVADYYAAEALPAGDWRRRLVEFRLPTCFEADHLRILQAQQKAIEAGKRRKSRRERASEGAESAPE